MAAVFAHRLAEIGAAVEAALDEVLSLTPKPGEIARPERLIAAMRYGALGGGKRLRPFLVIETARALGLEGDAPLKAGVAIECLHNYSLIHDDLPAMDDDDLRRGRPTAHRQFDEATAILAGDGVADARLRNSRRSGDLRPTPKFAPNSAGGWRAPPGSPAWWAARCSTSPPSPPRRRSVPTTFRCCSG